MPAVRPGGGAARRAPPRRPRASSAGSRWSSSSARIRAPGSWRLAGTEINLGVGGSTHPLLAVRFLTGGQLEPETGLFRSPSGEAKFYRATDNLHSEAYRRLLPEDLIDILTLDELHYSARGETGALFYMLGAISELGRVGMVAVGNSREGADAIFRRTVASLDAASALRIA